MSEIAKSLKQRGHEVTKEGTERDLLLPATSDPVILNAFRDILYRMMQNDELRKSIRNWSYDSTVHETHMDHIESYVKLCIAHSEKIGKIDIRKNKQLLYASSFEWYTSELLRREFGASAAGFGIRLKDADPRDEFDCIALLDNGLVYIECKTGKGDIYEEIKKFIRRDEEVSATCSVYLFDRDYTFQKGKEDLPSLNIDQAEHLGVSKIQKISIGNCGFFNIISGDRHFFASTSFDGLETRLRHMIRYINIFIDSDNTFGTERIERAYTHTDIPFTTPPIPLDARVCEGEEIDLLEGS